MGFVPSYSVVVMLSLAGVFEMKQVACQCTTVLVVSNCRT